MYVSVKLRWYKYAFQRLASKNVKEMSLYKNGLISFVLFEQPVLSKNIDSLWKMNLL